MLAAALDELGANLEVVLGEAVVVALGALAAAALEVVRAVVPAAAQAEFGANLEVVLGEAAVVVLELALCALAAAAVVQLELGEARGAVVDATGDHLGVQLGEAPRAAVAVMVRDLALGALAAAAVVHAAIFAYGFDR